MNLANRLKTATVSIGIVAMVACSTPNNVKDKQYHRVNVPEVSQENPFKGYKIIGDQTQMKLEVVAGIYAGSIKVKKDGELFSWASSYENQDPQFTKRALENADKDKNNIITEKEANELLLDVSKNYVDKQLFWDIK